jgi:hypothetical protein
MRALAHASPGSARVPRTGFGVAPKRTSCRYCHATDYEFQKKVRDREDVLANARDARAPHT